jgi:AraC-like DNA-binding protein
MTIETISLEAAIRKCTELATLVDRHTDSKGDGLHATAIDRLKFLRESDTSRAMRGMSEPFLAIVVQGKKEVLLNEETYPYGVAQYLVVAVDLPICGFAVEASPARPYLSFAIDLDPVQLCDIIAQINLGSDRKDNAMRGLFVSDAEPSLIDCAIRLTQLLDTPQDIAFLAPTIVREIYYRLLVGEQGEAVRQIATSGSKMHCIAKAIERIKADFAKPLRIETLAEHANMSISSFHRHFKAVTSMSPLQYQKQLRLLTARQMMLVENADATQTAYQVGYESPSQFSREYSRMFGAPPIRDIDRLRVA